MNSEQATVLVKDILTGIVPDADFGPIGPDTDFRQALELDSLDFLSFVEQLSEQAHCRLDEDDYARLTTLGSSTELLIERTASGD
ncbi:acyl carrier protein [Actinacidiphila bryophytorum]|uniref:Phosphopantetheine-binding protein n=1 Tax=Actinacidiphila bryophytorum TaxID=1436133 RepID=A0A9W4GYI6_9ACTN|nr:acyl carrier protein [Actinacidiphila bryophytorum]MBM9438419.1 acyl carrier protein [Actinacidiphila bryophytorum]MBN6542307.1 acyl carrier protein [Actinacidiphila bryophytorum]CAG7613779.1 Phosphopantetheine-binding protein [Actinacidiphila bryophytorum]